MSIKYRCKNLSELIDFVLFVAICAPNDFPKAYKLDLEEAFAKINESLDTSSAEIGDMHKMQRMRQLSADAHEAYRRGDDVKGAHLLQDMAQALKKKAA